MKKVIIDIFLLIIIIMISSVCYGIEKPRYKGKVRVFTKNNLVIDGRFSNLTEDTLSLKTRNGIVGIDTEDIFMSYKIRDYSQFGFFIGAAGGITYGLVAWSSRSKRFFGIDIGRDRRNIYPILGGLVGALVGVALGSGVKSYEPFNILDKSNYESSFGYQNINSNEYLLGMFYTFKI